MWPLFHSQSSRTSTTSWPSSTSFLMSSTLRSRNGAVCSVIPLLLLVLVGQSIGPDFQNPQRQQRALDARRRDLDAKLAQHVVLVDPLGVVERHALETLGQQRR